MNEDVLRNLSEEAYEQGDFDLAASYYRQLLEVQPHDYEVMADLGATLFLQSNFNAAAKVYSSAIIDLKDQGETGIVLGTMHIRLAETYLKLHRLEDAEVQLDLAAQTGASPTSLSEARGRGYNMRGEYEKALVEYKEYVRLAPTKNYGYLGMAKAYEGMKQYDLASHALEDAKTFTPADYWVEVARGNLAMTLQEYDNALSYYKAARELDPNKPAVTFSMGRAYLMIEDYSNARKMFSTTLASRPNDAASMHGLAQVEIIEGNTRQAIALLKSAVVTEPSNHSYHTLLVQAQVNSGRLLDALRTALQAKKLLMTTKTG